MQPKVSTPDLETFTQLQGNVMTNVPLKQWLVPDMQLLTLSMLCAPTPYEIQLQHIVVQTLFTYLLKRAGHYSQCHNPHT